VDVAALASASQATFSYTAPTSGSDTLTITNDSGSQTVNVTAGETNTQIASAINSDSSGVAYATVLSNGDLALSSSTTGDGNSSGTGNGNPISLSSAVSGSLTPVSTQAGQDAEVYINGSTTPVYSQNDTLSGVVPGITLTLNGVTPTNAPVTITTGAPAPNTSSIVQAVQQFVSDYNSAISGIESAINTAPPSESNSSYASPYTGSLFGDPSLENLLSNIRSSIYTTDPTLASGYQSLQDIGISTGASTGSATANSTNGLLTVNTATLTAAIQANPNAVEADLQSFSSQFQTLVNGAAGPAGSLAAKINGNNTEISGLNGQLTSAQQMYKQEEANLQQQWAHVEATLASLDSQKSSLTAFSSTSSGSSSSTGG
jgi:flagellar hook-associated protein 2